MGDLDRRPGLDAAAALAARPERVAADAADEARVAARVAEGRHLVEERRQPEVRVVEEAGADVGGEGLDRVGRRPEADAG
jgi:hypothetical protein